ncbi:MAG: helix-turn-helix transcriptional regulator, partial [Coriobacteriia bacterium]|nr:helix-turn-helix transcriptional regulator [Coriobacteriia bacterium]
PVRYPVQHDDRDERCDALVAAHGLTTREAEILLLTARGHSSTFIAEQLFISASTVRFHQQNIYRKLNVHSRQELLALVNEEGVS